jgi:Fur family ferric uptake transcriptional regulator
MQRMTTQRRAIMGALERGGRPLSPEEVLDAARGEVESLNLATVYRNLNALLSDDRLVRVQVLGRPPRYELAGLDHHHHFLCGECDRMFDLPACSGLKQRVPKGFEATGHELVMFGRCGGCG